MSNTHPYVADVRPMGADGELFYARVFISAGNGSSGWIIGSAPKTAKKPVEEAASHAVMSKYDPEHRFDIHDRKRRRSRTRVTVIPVDHPENKKTGVCRGPDRAKADAQACIHALMLHGHIWTEYSDKPSYAGL